LAIDFVLGAAARGATFALFARRPEAVAEFLRENGLPREWARGSLDTLGADGAAYGGVLNFVGVGDPAKAKAMGASIFEATRASDCAALRLLEAAPAIPYVFMSSGAVYGTRFDAPADADTPSCVPVNRLDSQDFYTVAKLHAEAVHRSCQGRTILDVRIFNYFSRRLDPSARFFVTDMIRAAREEKVFETADIPMYRDFLHPDDFVALLLACLNAPAGTNMPVDAYSRAVVSKRELLDLMADEFGLRYSFTGNGDTVNATGAKPFYYSMNRAAATLGFEPRYTSTETVRVEAAAMLARAPERIRG
jgi:nucleoside-diphosphate-sugar epimerase